MSSLFEYDAILSNGETIKGSFEGSKDEFEKMVSLKKITVVGVKEKKKKLNSKKFDADDFLALVEELYYLINSGMQIDQAVKMLIKTASKSAQERILKMILSELNNGIMLSIALKNALEKEGVSVDELSISFIATSEEVGELSDGLLQLFNYLSFIKKIRTDIRQAMAYPIFLMIMSVVVAMLIFFLIIPKFSTIFSPEEFEMLPSLSYAVLSSGKYLNAHMGEFFTVFGVIIGVIVLAIKHYGIPWNKILYKIPKISYLIVDIQLSIVYGALSTMLTGGLELDRALKQMQKISLIDELQDLLKNALYELKRGQKLSTVFSMSQLIPPSDIALLHVGESSASLDKVFQSLSVRHSDAFTSQVKKVLTILEPAVIVLLGIFFAVIVVAIMMAVMSMTDIAG
jgi:type II secretory pathway component PulF